MTSFGVALGIEFVVHWRAVQCSGVRSIHSPENAMANETLTNRVAQALLAVTATAASVLVVQLAMLTG
jgi:hypothetical protein